MADKKLKRQDRQELSQYDHGKYMAAALIDGMIQNPDEILQMKGAHDLQIYKEILRDDQVASVFQQRQNATVNAEYYVDEASDSADDVAAAEYIRKQLTMLDFDEITRKMLYAVHYGYAIAEKIYNPELIDGQIFLSAIKVRDRGRFKFDVDHDLYLHENNKKIKMPLNKFWVHSVGGETHDNPYGQGIAHALYWPVFFKRNCIKFWLIFLEKFGMPTVQVKMNRAQMDDPEMKELAHEIIDAIQVDSGVIVPEDFVVELIEASRSGSVDYSGFEDRMDAAISKVILSQTMTTDNGSSRSQAEVHNEVKLEVIKTDADLLCASFNQQIVNDLVALNFVNATPPTVNRRTEPEADLAVIAERDTKIMSLNYEPTEEYIEETYGPGWRKKEVVVPPTGNQNVPAMGPEFSDVSELTQKRVKHRQNMQDIVDAADYKAVNYEDIMGERVKQIQTILDDSSTLDDANKRIMDLMKEPVSEEFAEDIRNANFFSRLMGYAFGKRTA